MAILSADFSPYEYCNDPIQRNISNKHDLLRRGNDRRWVIAMVRRSGQDRYGQARSWLAAVIVSIAGPSAFAGDLSEDRGQVAGAQSQPLKREAPVFSYRQFTRRLPAVHETKSEAETADDASITLPIPPAYPPSPRERAGLMGRFENGIDAVSARAGLVGVRAEDSARQAADPGPTAAERESAQDSGRGHRSQQPGTALLGSGRASWYKHPGRTANGQSYNPDALTAAHHTLPFGTKVKVVNTQNGRAVVVEITDRTNERTKAKRNYAIDLSRASAQKLGIEGVGQVALYRVD